MRDLRQAVVNRIGDRPPAQVCTPVDFLDLGSRAAVDKVLQRLVAAGQLRRIDRGLYDTPRLNSLTKQPAVADYRQIIDALGRRDQLRMLVDGMTAANDVGLTTAVPARVVIHTDTRRRTIHLDNLTIEFKQTAPSKLYWSGRPAMRIVQALQWLKDTLPADHDRIVAHVDAGPRAGAAGSTGRSPDHCRSSSTGSGRRRNTGASGKAAGRPPVMNAAFHQVIGAKDDERLELFPASARRLTPHDTTGVNALVSRLVAASNANDVKAFAAIFAADADFTNVFGQRAQGPKEIEAFHAPNYVEPGESGLPSFVHARLRVLESRVRFIRPDVASVDVRWEQTGAISPDGKPWGRRIGLMNWVVARENGVWAVVVMHNMDLPETPPGRAR